MSNGMRPGTMHGSKPMSLYLCIEVMSAEQYAKG